MKENKSWFWNWLVENLPLVIIVVGVLMVSIGYYFEGSKLDGEMDWFKKSVSCMTIGDIVIIAFAHAIFSR